MNIDWPAFKIFFANVYNYVPRDVEPPPPPRDALALFGIIDTFRAQFTAVNTGGNWVRIENFSTPDLDNSVALISTGDADYYEMDIIGDFFAAWGFTPTLLELDMNAEEQAPPVAPADA